MPTDKYVKANHTFLDCSLGPAVTLYQNHIHRLVHSLIQKFRFKLAQVFRCRLRVPAIPSIPVLTRARADSELLSAGARGLKACFLASVGWGPLAAARAHGSFQALGPSSQSTSFSNKLEPHVAHSLIADGTICCLCHIV